MTVTVAPNTPPVANSDAEATIENAPITIYVLDNDFDPDGEIDFSSIAITSQPAHGTAVVDQFGGALSTPQRTDLPAPTHSVIP